MLKPLGPPGDKGGAIGPVTPSARVAPVEGATGRMLVAVDTAVNRTTPLSPGENVTARVLERLSDDRLRVEIKGGVLTLQLPAAAQDASAQGGAAGNLGKAVAGDVLPLRVASLTPQLTFVLTAAAARSSAGGSVDVKLSNAAQYINELIHAVPADAKAAAAALANAAGTVLLANPQAPPAQRADALAQAMKHGGLFYESHVQAWSEGRMSLGELQTEPQARFGATLLEGAPAERQEASAALGSLLQRQLDAADGKPLSFAGFAWPGQPAEWQVERNPRDTLDHEGQSGHEDGETDADDAPAWTTRIQLALPRLGALGAQIRVVGSQVTLALTPASESGAELMAAHRGRLATALQAAGLSLSGFQVQPIRQPTLQPIPPRDGSAEKA